MYDDALWQHQGWTLLKDLQQQVGDSNHTNIPHIPGSPYFKSSRPSLYQPHSCTEPKLRSMPELRTLIRSLGRRSAADGTDLKKHPPQREASDEAPLGVIRSPFAPLEAKGVRKSDVIEGLLPPELLLLAAFRSNRSEDRNSSSGETTGTSDWQEAAIGLRRRKLLFLAKKAEKALGSYERSGWLDTHSLPARRWRYHEKTPTHVGGPIIICLDTSGSMAGTRERLAKAVVLESAIMVIHPTFNLLQLFVFLTPLSTLL